MPSLQVAAPPQPPTVHCFYWLGKTDCFLHGLLEGRGGLILKQPPTVDCWHRLGNTDCFQKAKWVAGIFIKAGTDGFFGGVVARPLHMKFLTPIVLNAR